MTVRIDERLTLAMPTYPARQAFIDRAERYYAPFRPKLLIESNEKLSNFATYLRLLDQVTTPYVAMAADDDFYLPAALNQGVAFLEAHPDYALVHGKCLQFATVGNALYGEIDWVAPWVQREQSVPRSLLWQIGPFQYTKPWKADTPGKNDADFRRAWTAMFGFRPAAYCVVRTGIARITYEFIAHNQRQFEHMGSNRPRVNYDEWSEFMQGLIMHFHGKGGLMDSLYLLRQMHPQQISKHGVVAHEHHPPVRRWIRDRAPDLFRQAQFQLRIWPHRAEFETVRQFIAEPPC